MINVQLEINKTQKENSTYRAQLSTVISDNNNIEGGQQHIQTTEVLHEKDSVIMEVKTASRICLLNLCFFKK